MEEIVFNYTLIIKDDKLCTPEVEEWLRKVEETINEEMQRVWLELLVYGTAALYDGKHVSMEEIKEWNN